MPLIPERNKMPSERSRQLRAHQELMPAYLVVPKTAAYAMTIRDTLIKTDTSQGGFTITLPPVAECSGGTFMIKQVVGTFTTGVVDKGDSTVAVNNTAMNSVTSALLYFSDGERWFLVSSYT